MLNVTKCPKCGYSLIAEESQDHQCGSVLDYKIEGAILWLFDGEIWYPRKLKNQPTVDMKNDQSESEQNPRW